MDGYSRLVAWCKVVLPLMALVLLSTLFLLSRNIDPMSAIPFADSEIDQRLSGQQVTAPFFSGATASGDLVSVSMGTLATRSGIKNEATDFAAQIDLTTGTRITISADHGEFDVANSTSTLTGNVNITTSAGYDVKADALIADFDDLGLESPGPAVATGPFGTLNAGQFRLFRTSPEANAQLIFKNGVKLIYTPKPIEE